VAFTKIAYGPICQQPYINLHSLMLVNLFSSTTN
jgi:hypothetical protein